MFIFRSFLFLFPSAAGSGHVVITIATLSNAVQQASQPPEKKMQQQNQPAALSGQPREIRLSQSSQAFFWRSTRIARTPAHPDSDSVYAASPQPDARSFCGIGRAAER